MKAALGPLVIDELACSVARGDDRLAISRKAVELLIQLGRAGGRPVHRHDLLRDLWPDRMVSDKALSMLVVELRKQLAGCFPGVELIQTLPGLGYALSLPYEQGQTAPAAAWDVSKAHGRMSVIVELPAILSTGPKVRELAACWHDTLLNSLAGTRGLEVRSLEAVAGDVTAPACSLRIQSSVRTLGREVLIGVRCVAPDDGRVCWAASERGSLAKAFDVETALCDRLRHELEVDATGHRGWQIWRQYRHSVSFDALTEAQRLLATRSGHGFVAAREKFRYAFGLDPSCAPALVGLADCEILSAFHDGAERTSAAQRATVYVEHALTLDSQLSAAHCTRGFIHLAQLHFGSAERELLEAIRLDDTSAIALQWYADFLASQGRVSEAVQAGYLAVARAPDSVPVNGQLGQMLHMAGLYEEAQRQLERMLVIDPTCASGHCFLALNLAMLGDAAALEHGRRAVELSSGMPFSRGVYGAVLARFGERDRALQQLHALEANTSRSQAYGEAAVMVATELGQAKRAIDLLRSSTVQGATWSIYAASFPILSSIREEPTFKALVRGRGMSLVVS